MTLNTLSRIATSLAIVAGLSGLTACGDDVTGPDGPDAILGTWDVTSFAAGTEDLIANGMTLRITLDDDGSYTFVVTNDLAGVCGGEEGDDCTTTGSFAYTVSTVTIDDDEPEDITTFTYGMGVNNNNVMTWTGDIDGTPVEIDLTRVN